MADTYPQLPGSRTKLAWSGLMSYARHLMPQIGEVEPGVWHCTAFGGHGLNTTAIGGKLVAEAILGQSDRYRLFAPFGLVWTGGLCWSCRGAADLLETIRHWSWWREGLPERRPSTKEHRSMYRWTRSEPILMP